MNTVIVQVCESSEEQDEGGGDTRHLFRTANEWSYTIDQGDINMHTQGWQRSVRVWTCSERDINAVVEQLTKWHGDREIRVYKLSTVYYRTVGELNSKAVTKDGVLPF